MSLAVGNESEFHAYWWRATWFFLFLFLFCCFSQIVIALSQPNCCSRILSHPRMFCVRIDRRGWFYKQSEDMQIDDNDGHLRTIFFSSSFHFRSFKMKFRKQVWNLHVGRQFLHEINLVNYSKVDKKMITVRGEIFRNVCRYS